ncbi:MAG: winged helix-turn-helix domain-containing protein [Actinocatenispora sp.]
MPNKSQDTARKLRAGRAGPVGLDVADPDAPDPEVTGAHATGPPPAAGPTGADTAADTDAGQAGERLPHRTLRDPRELRAMAHPLRIRLLEELFLDGPLTATELSDRVGESPANCSWHLRQLARYGYVTEAGGGTGRQRPWQVVLESRCWGERAEGETAAAAEAMASMMYRREFDSQQAYMARQDSEPDDWYDAAFWSQSFLWLTADELAELAGDLKDRIMRHVDRFTDPSSRPADARPIRFVAWGVPARPWSEDQP